MFHHEPISLVSRADPPVCFSQRYWGDIFSPNEGEIHHPGDQIRIAWYLGRNVTWDQSYPFTVELHSVPSAIQDVVLINDRSYTNESLGVNEFTQCLDWQISQSLRLPEDLEVTQVQFSIVVTYVGDDDLEGWDPTLPQTGSVFTIAPTDQVTSTTSSSTAMGTSDPSNQPISNSGASPDNDDPSGLSTGAKAGIGVGVVAAVAIVTLAAWMFWRMRRKLQRIEKAQGGAENSESGGGRSEGGGSAGIVSEVEAQKKHISEIDGRQYQEMVSNTPVSEMGVGDSKGRPFSELSSQQPIRSPISEMEGKGGGVGEKTDPMTSPNGTEGGRGGASLRSQRDEIHELG